MTKTRLSWIGLIVATLGLLSLGKVFLNGILIASHPDGSQSISLKESKRFKIFLCEYSASIVSGDEQLSSANVFEVWAERNATDKFTWVWFHTKQVEPGCRIIVRINGSKGLGLWVDGSTRSFSVSGGYYCSQVLETLPAEIELNVVRGAAGDSIGKLILKKSRRGE